MKREQLIYLPKLADKRGNLSFIEARKHIPFTIARTYWIYNTPVEQERGGYALKTQHEFIIALSGSFDVVIDDGDSKRIYTLNRSDIGLYVPNTLWRSIGNFSANAICLILASELYDENDYIRSYETVKSIGSPLSNPIKKDQQEQLDIKDSTVYKSISDCSLIDLSMIKSRIGRIIPIQGKENIPFDIERVFYIYDIPSGVERGMHAHKTCDELLIAANGSFEVELDDGTNKKTLLLDSPMFGLHIPPGVWAAQKKYSSDAICLVLASEEYKSENYINTYSDFKKYRKDGDQNI